MSELVYDVVEPFNNVAKMKNLTLNVDIEQNIDCNGSKELLSKLVSILLDNALKYTNENGQIDFSLQSVSRKKKFVLRNTVDEIEKGNLDVVFERFYRLDKSRNTELGGSGTALSIAKEIVDIYNGIISAKSEDGKSFEITFII